MTTLENMPSVSFEELGLNELLCRALGDLGYEAPTPVQQQTIPLLLTGRDVIGQAQTGTGKTAAFALPILQNLDVSLNAPQALVLAPTRELALQVAEAFHNYARPLGRVRVLPIYGGQAIQPQLNRLKSGVQIVIGTPGRVMDHLRRGTLDLGAVKTVVLDEADEMLRMGFIEDVEWILAQAPEEIQKALFSATMPPEIHRIAQRYLREPATVEVAQRTMTVPNVEQRYMLAPEAIKLDAMVQLLESEAIPGEGILVFTRTRTNAGELAEALNARGYAAEALHGDLNQAQRENVIRRLRAGQLDIVTATDVAARGLDVERIGLVINYHMPYDPEWYVHRIGRTARAGRPGRAVLFVTPREQRLLRDIERYTRQPIKQMKLPTAADVAQRRLVLFKGQILAHLADDDLDLYTNLVTELAAETGRDVAQIAAAAARLARGDKPLVAVNAAPPPQELPRTEDGMVRLVLDVGRLAGVRPTDIVGALANETGIPGKSIGAIEIYDRVTFVEVPVPYRNQVLAGMAQATIRHLPAGVREATAQDRPARDVAGRRAPERQGGHAPRRGQAPNRGYPSPSRQRNEAHNDERVPAAPWAQHERRPAGAPRPLRKKAPWQNGKSGGAARRHPA